MRGGADPDEDDTDPVEDDSSNGSLMANNEVSRLYLSASISVDNDELTLDASQHVAYAGPSSPLVSVPASDSGLPTAPTPASASYSGNVGLHSLETKSLPGQPQSRTTISSLADQSLPTGPIDSELIMIDSDHSPFAATTSLHSTPLGERSSTFDLNLTPSATSSDESGGSSMLHDAAWMGPYIRERSSRALLNSVRQPAPKAGSRHSMPEPQQWLQLLELQGDHRRFPRLPSGGTPSRCTTNAVDAPAVLASMRKF
ncbi:hypothetical protein J1614_003636 [Plenodomus biglobosus]|nr:hypothetical protein J1614_003636 [Plenodomus biglobosus]